MSVHLLSAVSPVNQIKKRLRIAVLNRTFATTGGGAERYSIALVEQLAARHEIHVYAQHIDHQWPGVSYHTVSAPMLKPRWINQLWFATRTWWLTRKGFDVVHSHENTWHGDVQTVHVLPVKHNLFYGRKGWSRVLRWIKVMSSPRLLTYLVLERFRYAKRPGRQVVVTSDSLRSIMDSSYPACREMISVITPGITMPAPVTPLQKSNARAMLGLPTVGRGLLFVANDYRKKGLKTLLEALSELPDDVFLTVVGNPGQISVFREQVKIASLGKRVFFLGSLKEVAPAYEAADCLVHPTLEDTFAMVVLEAMSYGLPVVVSGSAYCGIAGLLQDGVNALLLEAPKDAIRLRRALESVLFQPELSKKLVQGAIDFASKYEWSAMALEQESLYFSAFTVNESVVATDHVQRK
ncbi:glycosyltransferase involved in cell wall biosynthesis [Polaromonas sp. CG_9.5]|uniref:glycosyltransferase family 4 protein n=1 Tax=Polaromonas sp. CG_9.5 TaxID=3071705 RepID=UPI002DFF17A5|nr:glycosyltransferase involved in cell wall biosynthesis [Polaromonas sp. CG_9.5]